MNFFSKRESKTTQLGLAENDKLRCAVWQQDSEIIDVQWHSRSANMSEIPLQAGSFSQKFTIIRPLPHQYIWRRTLFLPLQFPEKDIHKQVIQILKQQIPLPIDTLSFDYYCERQTESMRIKLIIYAIRKNYIKPLVSEKISVYLDCELHCYLRAFHYFLPESRDDIPLNSYHLNDISFQVKNEEMQINPKESLYQYHIEQIKLPDEILDKKLYLQALGASLWNGKG